jgi:hypothetical protein
MAIGLILIFPRKKQSPMNRTILTERKSARQLVAVPMKLRCSSMALKHPREWTQRDTTKEAKLIKP